MFFVFITFSYHHYFTHHFVSMTCGIALESWTRKVPCKFSLDPWGKILLYCLVYVLCVSKNWRSQIFCQQLNQQIFCSSIHQYLIFSKYQGTIQNNVIYVLITCLPKDNEPQLQRVLSSQASLRTKYQPWICLKKRKQI